VSSGGYQTRLVFSSQLVMLLSHGTSLTMVGSKGPRAYVHAPACAHDLSAQVIV